MSLIEGDLTAYHSISQAIRTSQPEFIFHLGALTPVRLSFEDPFPYLSVNFEGTISLVHAILEKARKTILIYASTAEVYGWQAGNEPIKETAPLHPASPYAVSKEAADQYVRMAMKIYDLKATIMRPINSYGRTQERGYFVEYVISTLMNNEICYVGTPNSIRDYMYVDDHINAYLLAMKSERALNEVFNVSPGNPVKNREVVELVRKITGSNSTINYQSYPPSYPQRPAMLDPHLVLDSSKIREQLGWRPSVTLEEGLRKTVATWKGKS
jgi:nucleoside-diphosphate-sugar epimerase